ncbi:MAG: alpha/beta hydrolase family protein [Halobacteriales archaeon]
MDGPRFQPSRWTEHRFDAHERRHAWDGETGEAFEDWRAEFRAALERALGLPTIRESGVSSLSPKRLEAVEESDHTREKWVIESEPGFRVPFYLLTPEGGEPPYPTVLAVHGHGHTGKELYAGRFETPEQRGKIEEGERDIGVQAVRRGYAALVPDMRGFGELSAHEDFAAGTSSCRTMQLHAQLFGRTLVGGRVWDVTRLIDFAEGREALDATRLAITGNSGGGTVSLFAGAVEDRIDVVVPASYFCTFADSIGSIHHCACNYVPGLADLGEMADVAGLIAPRPFLAINGKADDIFPIEATRRAFDRLAGIYDANGVGDRCELFVGGGGHRYYKDPSWRFIGEHL